MQNGKLHADSLWGQGVHRGDSRRSFRTWLCTRGLRESDLQKIQLPTIEESGD